MSKSKINVKIKNDLMKEVITEKMKVLESIWPLLNYQLGEDEVVNQFLVIHDIVDGKYIERRINIKNIIGYELERDKKWDRYKENVNGY